ncbi:hypothetical protein [Lentzea cavernae]|uniref:Uncharacterized protein n=1 Tax=Lentzea cavernae TaxID=2020703 RepID=A0ABQ3M9K0_9PSEU|nr:hypothetical protein [Lentzea cavernae]GHH37161.1 hypothetical protein GCM10017774_25440 [Lentzea cavernae]
MTNPQDPWRNPADDVQWQNPASGYPATGGYPVVPGQYQVNQVGQAGFGMAPLAPVLPQEMAPPRPPTITAAMWIWIAGAVLSVAVIPVLLLVNADFLIAGDRTRMSVEEREASELGLRAVSVMAGFAMLVAAAPYIAFAIVLRNGQNWARILLTILGALGVLSMVVTLALELQLPVWQPGAALCVVVIGLTVAAVVLQFLPASNRYVR